MKLGVNVDHVATLRQARGGSWPDPVEAAMISQAAGAHSVVMHLREDRRHIQDHDLFRAKEKLSIKLNLEMSIAPSIVKIAGLLLPDQVTLVPEKRMERTTEGGLNLFNKRDQLRRALDIFKKKKIEASLFIDPDLRQIEEARRLEVDAIELHTGDYANQKTLKGYDREWKRLKRAASLASEMGLTVHAGHGLDYENVSKIRKIGELEELNIGYSIIVRSLWVGMDLAVREMLGLIK